MSNALADKPAAACEGNNARVLSGAAEWLHLMAAPTFAIMALMTGMGGDGAVAMICAHDASPLGSMAAMYALMSAFHAGPWLKLLSKRNATTDQSVIGLH